MKYLIIIGFIIALGASPIFIQLIGAVMIAAGSRGLGYE